MLIRQKIEDVFLVFAYAYIHNILRAMRYVLIEIFRHDDV